MHPPDLHPRPPARTATPRRHAAVVVLLLFLSASVLVGELASEVRPSGVALAADAVVGLLACLSVPWLLSRPVGAVVVFVALSALVPTATPVAGTAVLWLARQRPLRLAAAGAVAGVAAQLLRGWWRPVAGVPLGWWTLVMLGGFAAAVGWGAWMQARAALVASLEERARRAEEQQAARVREARRVERTRIAREMHDVLAHRLSVLATVAGALEYHPNAPADELARAADVVRSTAHLALEDLREVIDVLRADETDEQGRGRPQPTLGDLADLVEEWRATGASVVVDDRLDPFDRVRVPEALGRTVYRVVQETLTNAAKHAGGEEVRVRLDGRPGGQLTVTVTNRVSDATRGPTVPGSGTGLLGLAERVELAGGRFEAGATSREHRVEASLPWPM